MLELESGIIRTDLDSHAEVCVLGKHCLVLFDYERPVEVKGYDPDGPSFTA